MNTYQRLLALYTQDQYQIKTGLVPEHFDQTIPLQLSGNHQQVPFTVLLKEGRRISAASGLHPLEIFMLEAVLKQHKPKNILVFGNDFGWNILACALSCPTAKVLSIRSRQTLGSTHLAYTRTKEMRYT